MGLAIDQIGFAYGMVLQGEQQATRCGATQLVQERATKLRHRVNASQWCICIFNALEPGREVCGVGPRTEQQFLMLTPILLKTK